MFVWFIDLFQRKREQWARDKKEREEAESREKKDRARQQTVRNKRNDKAYQHSRERQHDEDRDR